MSFVVYIEYTLFVPCLPFSFLPRQWFQHNQSVNHAMIFLFVLMAEAKAPSTAAASALVAVYILSSLVLVQRKHKQSQPKTKHWQGTYKRLLLLHNTGLAIANAAVLVKLCAKLADAMDLHTLHAHRKMPLWVHLLCDPQGTTFTLIQETCLKNYRLKQVELLDTLLVLITGGQITLLHVYHHAATLLLALVQLQAESSVQWVPIALNCCVHVFMYTFFALTTLITSNAKRKRYLWWKRYITQMQVAQFVLAVPACITVTLMKTSFRFPEVLGSLARRFSNSSSMDCHGTFTAAAVGIAILSSYLVLFAALLLRGFTRSPSAKSSA